MQIMKIHNRISGLLTAIFLIILGCTDTGIAQDHGEETFNLNNILEREFDIHRNIIAFDKRFGDFNTWNYSAYNYRRALEINRQLYDNISKLTLSPRDRIKLTDRIFFSIHNKYIPGFMQLYTMPIAKPPENPNLIYENDGN